MDWILMLMIGVAGAASTFIMIQVFSYGYRKDQEKTKKS